MVGSVHRCRLWVNSSANRCETGTRPTAKRPEIDTQILRSPELVAEKIDEAIEEETTKLRNPGEEEATWLRVIERCDRNEAADQEMYREGVLKMDALKANLAQYEVQRTQAREKIAEYRAGQERGENRAIEGYQTGHARSLR